MTQVVTFEEAVALTGQLKHWLYNCGDSAGTRQIHNELWARLERAPRKMATFQAQMAFQTPAFAMGRRGILIDQGRRTEVLGTLEADIEAALAAVNMLPLVRECWDGEEKETGQCPTPQRKDGKHKWEKWETNTDEHGRLCSACGASRICPSPFNANSVQQVAHLMWNLLGIPPQKNKKGETSTDEDVLTRLSKRPPTGTPGPVRKRWDEITALIGWEADDRLGIEGTGILHVRSLTKQRGEAKAPLSPTGRYMTTINIGAAWTGRASSSKAPNGLGGNVQNKAQRMRPMFIPDRGFEMGNFDLMRAESQVVAYLADDEGYIEAHKTDTHTFVARLVFPELPWNGDIKKDAAIAKSHFPPWDPNHDYRHHAKATQHAGNYGESPRGIAMRLRIPQRVAEEAQGRYFDTFPGIQDTFQAGVRERIRAGLPLVSPLGREVQLLGRPWDNATFRQGYSAIPQGLVSDLVWLACCLIYRDLDPHLVQLLQNGYDSALMQWRPEDRAEAVEAVVKCFTIPVIMPSGKAMVIPVEGAVGTSWGKADLEDVYP